MLDGGTGRPGDARAPELLLLDAALPDMGAPPAQASTEEPKRAFRIAAIGDSLTDPRSHGGAYLGVVAKKCPRSRIDNFAKGAAMVNQMRRTFENEVLSQPPSTYTHLVVFGGVNDLYSDLTAGRTVEKISRDLRSVYEAATARGMAVVAITVAPWGGFARYHNERRQAATLELNRFILQQAGSDTVRFVVDAYELLSCGTERLCPDYEQRRPDGLHFNRAAHEALGNRLYEAAFRACL